MGTITSASISKKVIKVLVYMCTKFGAFFIKYTIDLVCRCTISCSSGSHNGWLTGCRDYSDVDMWVWLKASVKLNCNEVAYDQLCRVYSLVEYAVYLKVG